MIKPLAKKNPILKIINSTFIELPAPANISYIWNLGSLLFICLGIQIITGVLLASSYRPSIDSRFDIIIKITEDSDKGWFLRYLHANGASLFFLSLYIHVGRGLYFNSFHIIHTWLIGVTILLITIAAAFIGYVLPVNQIRFWGVSVITNLFSEIPIIGGDLVKTIWGGPSVDNPTIVRFFTFHFIIPFIILALTVIHVTYLHTTGSSNPLGVTRVTKTIFNPFFKTKDLFGIAFVIFLFTLICLYYPLALGDDENFALANPSVTPHHIQPEWYFLFAYAILRSIPNKLGGVIALALSVLVFYTLPITTKTINKRTKISPLRKLLFFTFLNTVILLTFIGICPVEDPYILVGQILTVIYFIYFFLNPVIIKISQ